MKKLYFIIAVLIPSSGIYSQTKYTGNQTSTVSGVTILGRSSGGSCVSPWVGCTHQLWADPWLNEIALVRYHDTIIGHGIYYDLSKDGGNTWAVDYAYILNTHSDAAYWPGAGILNPSGVLNPDSAYVTYSTLLQPSRDIFLGQHQVTSGIAVSTSDHPGSMTYPTDYTVTRLGTTWSIEDRYDSAYNYDKIILRRGDWNFGMQSLDYTVDSLQLPLLSIVSSSIAFAPDGLTGYIVVVGDNGTYPDSVLYPIVLKTHNGGVTWGAPVALDMSGVDVYLHAGTEYTINEHCDIAVDANGELHIAATISPAPAGYPWSWWLSPPYGSFGIFDIYSDGPQWKARKIANPQNFSGEIGPGMQGFYQYNRPQVSIDSSGTKLFYVWSETDTAIFGAPNNTNPDIYISGYDITSEMSTPVMNITSGSVVWSMSRFHQVSHYCLFDGTNYEIPTIITVLDNEMLGSGSDVTYEYLNDNYVSANAFTLSDSSAVVLNSAVSVLSPQRVEQTCNTLILHTSDKGIVLRSDRNYQQMRLLTIQGREVLTQTKPGAEYNIPGSILSPGIYIYQLNGFDGDVCTGKFIIE